MTLTYGCKNYSAANVMPFFLDHPVCSTTAPRIRRTGLRVQIRLWSWCHVSWHAEKAEYGFKLVRSYVVITCFSDFATSMSD